MLSFITLMYVAAVSAVAGVEYWLWLRRRINAGANRADQETGRRLSFLTESFVAIGAILVVAGSDISISEHWFFVTNWARFGMLAVVAICLLTAGFMVRWLTASATEPLTESLWCASVACVAVAAAIAASGIYRQGATVTVLVVGVAVAVHSAALWLLCRREALLAAAFAGLVTTLCCAVPLLAADAAPWLAVGLGLWLLGLAWAVLGWLYPEPFGTSVPAGAALALIGPAVAVHDNGWVYVIGIVTAAAVMAASVPLQNVLLVAFGSCALLGYITAVVLRYADRSIGAPGSLVIIGLTLIALAITTTRLNQHRT